MTARQTTSAVDKAKPVASVPIEMTEVVAASGHLSGLDKRLLEIARVKNGRISAEELAEQLGIDQISPARAMSRLREILLSHDLLDMAMRKALILEDMVELKEHLMEIVRSEGGTVTDKNGVEHYSFGDPRWSANLLRVFKEMNRLIEVEQKMVDDTKMHLRNQHAALFYEALELAFRKLLFSIRQQYPDVDEGDLREYMEEALPAAFGLIEARTEQG